jgi:hypothetical protein
MLRCRETKEIFMRKVTLFLSAALFSFVLGVSGLARAEEAAKSPPPAAGPACPHMKKGEGGEKKDCSHAKGDDCPCKHEGAMKDCAKDCPHKAKGDCPCAKGGEAPADCPCQGKGDKGKAKGKVKPEKKATAEKKEEAK